MAVVINGTTGVSGVDGSAGTPSYQGTDSNTGIFFPAADTIAFGEGGVEAMRINSGGTVMIGTSTNAGGRRLNVVGRIAATNSDAVDNQLLIGADAGEAFVAATYASNGSYQPLTFYTSATERMRIDSSGNVGIGTSSPSTAANGGLTLGTTSAGKSLILNSSSSGNNGLIRFIDSNGSASLEFVGGTSQVSLYGYGSRDMLFWTNGTERARITSGGNLLVGDTVDFPNGANTKAYFRNTLSDWTTAFRNTNAAPFGIRVDYSAASPNGTGNSFLYCNDSTALRAEIRSNGGLANYSANNVNLASDERLKKDISPLATTWDKVKAIEVINFRYKDCNEGDPLLYGVIAQQVQPIVPELVVVTQEAKEAVEAKEAILDEEGNVVEPAVEAKEATPEYFGIREQPMYWLAIKALQEAMTRIEALEAEVAALKGAN